MKLKIIIFVFFIFLIALPPVYAHKPLQSDGSNTTFENALIIPDHKISWAIYEELDPYQTKFYSFDAKKGESFYSSIVIPKLERLENYKPSMALIGKGIEIQNIPELTERLPDGGKVVFNYDGVIPSEEFYEPFGQATYWERQEIQITIPQDGMYYLMVFDKQGFGGKYSLAVGKIESFSFIDFITILPTAWLDTKFFFEDYVSPLIFFLLVFGIPIGVILLRKRKKLRFQLLMPR